MCLEMHGSRAAGCEFDNGKDISVYGEMITTINCFIEPWAERMPTADNFVIETHNKGCLSLQPKAQEIVQPFVIEKYFTSTEAGLTS